MVLLNLKRRLKYSSKQEINCVKIYRKTVNLLVTRKNQWFLSYCVELFSHLVINSE